MGNGTFVSSATDTRGEEKKVVVGEGIVLSGERTGEWWGVVTSLVVWRPANRDTAGMAVVVVTVVVVVGNVATNLPGEMVFSSAAYESTGVVDEILMTVFEMRDSTVVGKDEDDVEEEEDEGEGDETSSPAKFTTPKFTSPEWFDKTGRISSPEIGDGTGASRSFLKEELLNDSDWSPVIDELTALLSSKK